MLNEAPNFVYSNYSIPKDDPVHTKSDTVLFEAIKRKMTFCNAIIIMAGVYSSYSKWIEKEIKIANNSFNNSKPIIAVEPWGSEKTSQIVKNNAVQIAKWNTISIVNAIRANAI
jgi:hypothetical protein